MIIEGTYTLQASPEDVWQCLMDRQILLEIIPGIEQLEMLEGNSYAIAIAVKHAPLKGTYCGRVTISEQQFPYHYRLTIDGEGHQHSISGSGSIHLNKHENQTIIAYSGTLMVGKLPTLVSKGAAKLLIQHFFTALADYLRTNALTRTLESEQIAGASVIKQSNGSVVILPSPPPSSFMESIPPSLRIVRLLKLGQGNATQEALWTKRIRQAGILSGLLFLVWVGTRLPRRG